MKTRLVFLAFLCFASTFVFADEGHHHEDITEAQVGTVRFPSSCAPSIQPRVQRGVAMLHSFWYEEAQKNFEEIEKDDRSCAIAHWGVAMSLWHQLWNRPDWEVLQHGGIELQKAQHLHATARERGYIAALNQFYNHPKKPFQQRVDAYSAAMEKLTQKYPDDHEAAAFYALSLLAAEPDKDDTNAYRKKAAAVLEKLFAEEPNHPGVAHYLIHTYDTPDMAKLGLPAARRYAQLAPAAPHALHMPSHIFARLGLWQDDINSNLASIAATRQETAMHMGGEGHQFHAMDFLVYAYLQTGREQDAEKIIDEIRAMPPMHDMYGMGFDPRYSALSSLPAAYALELHDWSQAAQLKIIEGASKISQSMTYSARAVGAAHLGNIDEAKKDVVQLEAIQKSYEANKKHDQGEYEGASDDLTIAKAWLTYAQGHVDDAVKQLRPIADKERGEAEASEGIPVHEMIGDMLLQAKRPEEALVEYQATLKNNPGRFDALYGAAQAAAATSKDDQAKEYYAEIVKNCANSTSDRAELKRAREEAGSLAQTSVTAPKSFPAYKRKTAKQDVSAANFAHRLGRLASS